MQCWIASVLQVRNNRVDAESSLPRIHVQQSPNVEAIDRQLLLGVRLGVITILCPSFLFVFSLDETFLG